MTLPSQQPIPHNFVRKAVTVIGLVTAVAIMVLLIWQILDIFMLVFAGILLCVFLTSISGWIQEYTPLTHRWALAVTTVMLLAIIGLFGVLIAPSLIEQGQQLSQNLQSSVDSLQNTLSEQEWTQPILAWLPSSEQLDSSELITRISGFFSRTFGMLTNVVVILFVGFYLAFEPNLYARGLIKLTPPAYRHRAGEVLDEVAYTLRWWLAGRLATMVVIGVVATVGLYLLGIPLALFLGVLAGLLAFIPVVGPVLALIPPLLIAFTISPTRALYVFILYMILEILESYLITPIIQRKTVDLPPVLLIFLQMIFGLFFDVIGLLIAAPAAAVLVVLTKMLYVGDVLGDYDTDLPNDEDESDVS